MKVSDLITDVDNHDMHVVCVIRDSYSGKEIDVSASYLEFDMEEGVVFIVAESEEVI